MLALLDEITSQYVQRTPCRASIRPQRCGQSDKVTVFVHIEAMLESSDGLARRAAVVRQQMVDKRAEHRAYVRRAGEDLPEVREWAWPSA